MLAILLLLSKLVEVQPVLMRGMPQDGEQNTKEMYRMHGCPSQGPMERSCTQMLLQLEAAPEDLRAMVVHLEGFLWCQCCR